MTTHTKHARVWRTEPFPAGLLYWELGPTLEYPPTQAEAVMLADRWKPYAAINPLHRPQD